MIEVPPPPNVYATSGSWSTPPTLTIIDVVEATVKSKSKEVVLPSVVSDCFLNNPVIGDCPIYAIN